MKNNYSMTEGRIIPSIIMFALPLLGSSLIQQLYNTADLIFVGNYTGANGAAAVGSSGLIFTCLIGLFTGISVGVNILMAHAIGAGDKKQAERIAHTALIFSVIGGVLLTIIGLVFARPVLQLLRTPDGVMAEAVSYVRIYFLSMTFMILYNMGSSVLRACGDSQTPFRVLVAGGIANVILDFLLIAVFRLGVQGAAIATSLSQFISAVGVLWCLMRPGNLVQISFSKLCLDIRLIKKILHIGLPAGIQAMVITLSNIIVQWYINGYGTESMAAFAAYFKVENFIYMPIMAFGQAITTYTGQNYGAGQMKRIRKGTIVTVGMSVTMTIFMAVIIIAARHPIFRCFVNDSEVIALSARIITVSFPFYWLYSIQEIVGGSVRGMGYSITSMIVTLSCLCAGRIGLLQIMSRITDDIRGIAAVYPMTWGLAAVCFVAAFIVIIKKRMKLPMR